MKLLYFLLLVCFSATVCIAQSEDTTSGFRAAHQDFFKLLTGEGRDIEMHYLLEPKSESKSGNGRFSLQQIGFSAEIPIPIQRDFFLRFAPEYDARFYKFSGARILDVKPGGTTFHRAVLGFGAGEFIRDDLFVTGKFSPAVVSDLDGRFDHEQLQYFGQGIIVYQYQTYLQLLAGAVSDRLFRGTDIYPVAALRFRSVDNRWHLKLTPPIDARLGYQLTSDNQLYVRFSQTGDDYRTFLEDVPIHFDIRIEDRHLGVGLLHWLDSHFNISFEIGAVIGSTFKFKIDAPDLPNEDTDPNIYSYFSLGYAL